MGVIVMKMTVTDGDEPHSPAWNAKFKILGGDPSNMFSVETGSNKNEGIITTVKVSNEVHAPLLFGSCF